MDDILSGDAARTGSLGKKKKKKIGKIYTRNLLNNGKHGTRYKDKRSLKLEVYKRLIYYIVVKGLC